MRPDIIAVSIISCILLALFGWRLTDKEDLMASGMLILTILVNGIILLLNHWSVSAHEFFAYNKLKAYQIEKCSHVRVTVDNKKQNVIKRHIVPIIIKHVELVPGKVSIAYQVEVQKKRFSYSLERKTFSQIPYPVQETIEFYQQAVGIE